MTLRALTWLISFAMHGLAVAFFFAQPGGAALDVGSGADSFVVEQGIAQAAVEAIEAPPQVLQSQPPVDEIKPVEEDVQHVIGSDEGPEQEKIVKEPEPDKIEEPKPKQMAVVEQTEAAVEEKKATGDKQSGGDTTAMSAYRGKLFAQISKRAKKPGLRQAGRVVIRFTVGMQGELISREITESSGSKDLDDAAMASIERSAPFPPLPGDIASASHDFFIPFKFTVQ